MLSQVFPFDNSANYTPSDANKLQVSGGKASLKLTDNPGNDFTENFDSETGHTHDANSEIAESRWRQINKRPDNAVLYNNFELTDAKTNPQDANFAEGTAIGTLNGGASIVSGVLRLIGEANCDWNNDNIVTLVQTGCIRIRFRPLYSGAAPAVQMLFWANNSTQNRIMVRINAGFIQCYIYDNTATLICNISFSFSAISGNIYEIELNLDANTGMYRAFLQGVLEDSDTGAGTRGASLNFVRCGGDSLGHNIEILDVLIFDTVQHTSNYTPDWSSIPDADYLESYDTLPEMEYTGAGTLVLLTALTYSKQGNLKIALQKDRSGVWDYWDGAQWTTGNGMKDYMCTIEDFVANIATLIVSGSTIGQFKLYLPDSNMQGWIDYLTATLTAQIYSVDNPYYDINSRWYIDALELISAVKTITGSDQIKVTLKKGDTFYYILSGVLTESDGTYAQSTTIEDWETYKDLFTSIKTYIGIRIFFHSEDGTTTPDIDTLTIGYSYAGDAPDTIDKCNIWFTYLDDEGTPTQSAIKYRRILNAEQYKISTIIERKLKEFTPDTTGYTEKSLIPGNYKFIINERIFYKIVPNEENKIFWDLEDWT